MRTLADYQVIHRGSFLLSLTNQSEDVRYWKEFTINLPSNLVFGEHKSQLVLQYEIQPDEESRLEFYMNNRLVSKATYSKSHTRMAQIVFPYSAAVPERCHKPSYPIKFALDVGQLKLKDIVLWYQQRIDVDAA